MSHFPRGKAGSRKVFIRLDLLMLICMVGSPNHISHAVKLNLFKNRGTRLSQIVARSDRGQGRQTERDL